MQAFVYFIDRTKYRFYMGYVKLAHYFRDFRMTKVINFNLLGLIALYLVIEVLFNYILFSQMSIHTSTSTIDDVEFYSKIVSGIGISLLLTKSLINNPTHNFQETFILFLAMLFIGIPSSIYIQKGIVKVIVDNSSDEERTSALLIAQASATIVPTYDDELKDIPFNKRQLFHIKPALVWGFDKKRLQDKEDSKKQFFVYGHACSVDSVTAYKDIYPINSQIDKGFFPYLNLLTYAENEQLHKKVIRKFNKCMTVSDEFVQSQKVLFEPIKQQMEPLFHDYNLKSSEYYDNLKRYPKYKAKIDAKWRESANETFGFKTNIQPALTREQFFKDRDVQKLITKRLGDNPNPYNPNFKQEAIKHPDFVFTAYNDAKKRLDKPVDNRPAIDEKTLEVQKKAYKSIVVPMVGLGFSVLFMYLNAMTLISLILSENSKRLGVWVSRLALPVFFLIPFLNIAGQYNITHTVVYGKDYLVQIIYFYEKLIIAMCNNLINPCEIPPP